MVRHRHHRRLSSSPDCSTCGSVSSESIHGSYPYFRSWSSDFPRDRRRHRHDAIWSKERERVLPSFDLLERCQYSDLLVKRGRYGEAEHVLSHVNIRRLNDAGRLKFLTSRAGLLRAQHNHTEAEEIAQTAWHLRTVSANLNEDEQGCLKTLCKILQAKRKYREAEILHRRQYDTCGSHDQWTIKNGLRMCQMIAAQGDINRAHLSLTAVWNDSRRHLGDRHELTIQCGCTQLPWLEQIIKEAIIEDGPRKDVTRVRRETLEYERQDLLRAIWKVPLRTKHVYTVMGAGHKLGEVLLQNKKKNTEAETVLNEVWTYRKQYLGESHRDTQATGIKLAVALKRQPAREKCEKAVKVLSEMWWVRHFGRNSAADLEHGEALAHACFCAKSYIQAEQVYVWCFARSTSVAVRWRIRCRLGQSILHQGDLRIQEAFKALHMVWNEARLAEPDNHWRLKSGLCMAEILGRSPHTISAAIFVAKDVFRLREKAGGVDYLQAGCLLGMLQANAGYHIEAKEVLRSTWRYPSKSQEEHQIRMSCGAKYADFERRRGCFRAAADIEGQIVKERLRLKL